ncbi:MAG TPA: HD domain-containing phosphohydrolase [Azospira sp.]|nr:HD domain-containing phosphohydrolase [Azospira sp.]
MTSFEDRLLAAPILVVDDNEANILLLENLLRQRGYRNVHATGDPFRVVPLHREQQFALILLDMQMPGMDGLGVMRQLRAEMPGEYLPVLVITAQTDGETRLKALELGARDYVTKPFVVTELAHRIRNLMEVQIAYRDRLEQAEILERKVRERTRELQETQFEILHRLARAGEYRDNETGNHVHRVSQSSRALALAAGLDEAQAEMILHASPMHDVGKIGIPDHILLRPGRLEGEDLEHMRRHVEIGGRILDGHDAPIMRMAHRIALGHHERWDGDGYPNRLAGEAIPIEARIVAVCDVFDALTSVRPYKPAWPVEEALAYLREQSGRHFDPRLVDRFLAILPAVESIREHYRD